MGFLMQITSLIVQNSVEPRDMGVASSSRMFFQQIGGSIGVSLFGVIFTRRLAEAMSVRAPGVHIGAGGAQLDPATVNTLPAAVRSAAFFGHQPRGGQRLRLGRAAAAAGLRAGPADQGGAAAGPVRAARGGRAAAGAGARQLAQALPGPGLACYIPPYGTASRISTVERRPLGRL